MEELHGAEDGEQPQVEGVGLAGAPGAGTVVLGLLTGHIQPATIPPSGWRALLQASLDRSQVSRRSSPRAGPSPTVEPPPPHPGLHRTTAGTGEGEESGEGRQEEEVEEEEEEEERTDALFLSPSLDSAQNVQLFNLGLGVVWP